MVGGLAVVAGTSRTRLWAVFAEVAHLLAIAAGDVLGASRLWAIRGYRDVNNRSKQDQISESEVGLVITHRNDRQPRSYGR